MSRLVTLDNFFTSHNLDPDKFNLTMYSYSKSVHLTLYHETDDLETTRAAKRIFGPLKESGYEGNKSLSGSFEYEDLFIYFTLFDALICEKTGEVEVPLDEQSKIYMEEEKTRLEKSLKDGYTRKPIYKCKSRL